MRPGRRTVRSAGFSLLEILIVLAISTGLLVFVAPNLYRSISGAELPNATQQLASALRQSQSHAISYSEISSLILNVDDRSYQLSAKPQAFQLPRQIDLSLLTGSNLIQGSTKGSIVFYPDGSSSGGRITLQLGERLQQIDINWLTGEVSVRDDV